MIKCIYIELYKLFHQKNIYVYFSIIALISLLSVYVMNMERNVDGTIFPLTLHAGLSPMIMPIIVIIFINQLFSDDFKYGTIKNLLTRPIQRFHLFLAKYFTLFIFILVLYFFTLIVSYLMSGIFIGFHQILDLDRGWVLFFDHLTGTAYIYFLSIFPLFSFAALMSIPAIIIKSSGMMITIGIMLVFSIPVITSVLPEISPWFINTYFNVPEVLTGVSFQHENETIISWTIVALYAVFSFMVSYWIFLRKDIEA